MAVKKRESVKVNKGTYSTKAMPLLPFMATEQPLAKGSRVKRRKDQLLRTVPIVGIGASAGGLAAFEAFFSALPTFPDPGIAFVLVQHLAPDHESILVSLIQRCTNLQVFEVVDGMVVKPNCVYIIPPGRDMALLNGTLQLFQPTVHRGQRLSIDFFFRSLAQELRERAICIVLSGSGSDGTLGMKAVKGAGGMVMAQSPGSTEYAGMPSSAIATGLVDFVLSPGNMPNQLKVYVAQAFGALPPKAAGANLESGNTLKKILILLREQTGHDFSQYKLSTINPSIERRMAVIGIEKMGGYLKHLQHIPKELDALFNDILVGVTKFFRDPEIFKVLEKQIIPRIFAGKPEGTVIRVWVPGCSTGEEAYSIAILLHEHLDTLKENYPVQIFATDINGKAISLARSGTYPASVADDIATERLIRYFTHDPKANTYRIQKNIRDLIVFSEQNVTRDPPFSKVDLISCRNLLIYAGADLQKKLIPLFHYALNPDGFLFLGTSETVGEFSDLFKILNRKAKLYQRKHNIHAAQRLALHRFLPSMTVGGMMPYGVEKKPDLGKLSLRELTERTLLVQAAQTGALVNGHGDILYLHGRTGMYLEPTPGEVAVNNILKMARDGLRHELASILHRAAATLVICHHKGLTVKTNSGPVKTNLTIRPLITGPAMATEAPLFLVIFEEVEPESSNRSAPPDDNNFLTGSERREQIALLKQELQYKDEHLQTTNEELGTANQRLKYSNEEMHSVNEELKSANEELETAKEEVQSINEEMATVNSELQSKVSDLMQANNSLNNLLAGTGIATIFVDHGLYILRFTPTVTRVINLIPSDVGRFIGHIGTKLVNYDQLAVDIQSVLDTLIAKEVDVKTSESRWFTMRIIPYRTLNNIVEGAVITFVNTKRIINISEKEKCKLVPQIADDGAQNLHGMISICPTCQKISDDKEL